MKILLKTNNGVEWTIYVMLFLPLGILLSVFSVASIIETKVLNWYGKVFVSFLVEYTASTIFSLISTAFLGNVFLASWF